MLQVFGGKNGTMRMLTTQEAWPAPEEMVWVDCVNPTREEELRVETLLGLQLPTPEEMAEIEVSNRLYEEQTTHGPVYTMTATLVGRSDSDIPETGPVTFILAPHHLVTLRYNEYKSFNNFAADWQKHASNYTTADRALAGLVEHVVERLADLLERVGNETENISTDLFALKAGVKSNLKIKDRDREKEKEKDKKKRKKPMKPRELLNRVGAVGNLDAKVRESLVSLQRLVNFLNEKRTHLFSEEGRSMIHAMRHDIQALCEHSYFLADKITFLLDATLGLINIEQNDIIRIFSIAAVMFMPPTLIASIYGMNFKHMHELNWELGYEYALMLMLCSTLIPFFYFKKKGWM